MKINYLFVIFISLVTLFFTEIYYFSSYKTENAKFVKLSKSYNLALCNETIAIRFKNESSIFDKFGISPTSRELFVSTFVYGIKK